MSVSIQRFTDELAGLPLDQLRAEWHRWHPDKVMPDRLPRDLLVRTIAWKAQEKEFGSGRSALTKTLDRLSSQLSRSGVLDLERQAQVKPGTTLIREWRGQSYRVTALDDGYQWDGHRYQSLSEIARAITGVRWSGPKFFGLKPRIRTRQSLSSEQPHDRG